MLLRRQLQQVLHFEKRDWYTVIVNECEVLCRTQETRCLQDKGSCPAVWNRVKASSSIGTDPKLLGDPLGTYVRPTMLQMQASAGHQLAFDCLLLGIS